VLKELGLLKFINIVEFHTMPQSVKKKFCFELAENESSEKYVNFIFTSHLHYKNQPCIFAPR